MQCPSSIHIWLQRLGVFLMLRGNTALGPPILQQSMRTSISVQHTVLLPRFRQLLPL